MPKKYPPEFKRDVVTVARRGDLTVPEVAVDFGGHANGDGGDYDEEEDHGCLDVVGEEGDFETAESWRSQYWI